MGMTTAIARVDASCLRCGDKDPDWHHHREGGGGKGMGGTPLDELPTYPLCRSCHDSLHRSEWTLSIVGEVAFGFVGEVQLFRRGISLGEKGDNPSTWNDEKLAYEWRRAGEHFIHSQARLAYEFWARFGWTDERRDGFAWYKRAAEILTSDTKKWPLMYDLVKVYLAFGDDAGELWHEAGRTLAVQAAKSENPEEAAGFALEGVHNGHLVHDIKDAMKDNFSPVETSEKCIVHCQNCDQEITHRRRL